MDQTRRKGKRVWQERGQWSLEKGPNQILGNWAPNPGLLQTRCRTDPIPLYTRLCGTASILIQVSRKEPAFCATGTSYLADLGQRPGGFGVASGSGHQEGLG